MSRSIAQMTEGSGGKLRTSTRNDGNGRYDLRPFPSTVRRPLSYRRPRIVTKEFAAEDGGWPKSSVRVSNLPHFGSNGSAMATGCSGGTTVPRAMGCSDGTTVPRATGCSDGTTVPRATGCSDDTTVPPIPVQVTDVRTERMPLNGLQPLGGGDGTGGDAASFQSTVAIGPPPVLPPTADDNSDQSPNDDSDRSPNTSFG